MAAPDTPSSPLPGPLPGQQPPKGSEPRPRRVRTPREFNAQLVNLRTGKGLTLEELNKRSQGRLPKSTVSNNLNKNTLPARDFVERYVRACGGDEAEVARWLSLWQTLNAPVGSAPWRRIAGDLAGTLRPLRRSLPRGSLPAAIMAVILTAVIIWWRENPAPPSPPAPSAQHCNTANQGLIIAANGECVGVTDGIGTPRVFGPAAEKVVTLIAEENKKAMAGSYVTVALLAPIGKGQGSLTGERSAHQLEGLLTAQRTANGTPKPNIRLVLANMGRDESHWRYAVDQLKTMTKTPDRLVAVVGMGLSQQESVEAARTLSAAGIPMVSDVITADSFGATKTIDGKNEEIPGLLRVAPSNTSQLEAIRKHLKDKRLDGKAILLWTDKTPQGSSDLYALSLKNTFLMKFGDLLGAEEQRRLIGFNSRGKLILPDVCDGEMVLYAGRQTLLPELLQELKERPCPGKRITVITGSDAAAQAKDVLKPANGNAPISLIYVPLADPGYLRSAENKNNLSVYMEFEKKFGEKFSVKDLETGWAIMSHDALLTAIRGIQKVYNQRVDSKDRDILPDHNDVYNALNSFKGSPEKIPGAGGFFTFRGDTGSRMQLNSKVVHVNPPAN